MRRHLAARRASVVGPERGGRATLQSRLAMTPTIRPGEWLLDRIGLTGVSTRGVVVGGCRQ